ncbi:MAG: FAD-dependent pyridine nucleotide-disulfide oxidoreductase [Gemmatimonadetes bacterium]|nr:FAD-dependent pyridine nucleotide-disulfide oxidoreductase [Gemmatimonadota bacterium]
MTEHRLIIIGSGFAGIGAAIRLKQAGVHDFVILERAADLGGVWRDNSYPGCACDVESHLYEFAFAPNPDWTRRFSPSAEIRAYLRDCAERFGVTAHVRYDETVADAAWDDGAARWRVTSSGGEYTAGLLVAATGALSEPRLPDLPGIRQFQGPVFHSAQWDHGVDLTGRQVAVLGTGASAVQFIPAVQPRVGRLTVFQRTPGWVIPRHDRATPSSARALFRRFPAAQRIFRSQIDLYHETLGVGFRHPAVMRMLSLKARRHLRKSVPDPVLRQRLTPDFMPGCKRILLSDDYLPALTRPNVEVVSGAATGITPTGVVGSDGVERPADVIICGTGFQVTEFPFARWVHGRDGTTLEEAWRPSAVAHLGTTVAGFPNLFIVPGPNTGLGHSSVIMMFEAQIDHLLDTVRHMDAHRLAAVEPKPEVQAAYVAEVDRQMARTVWVTGGCRSWYLDASGRNSTLWPGTPRQFRRRVERFLPKEYLLRHA